MSWAHPIVLAVLPIALFGVWQLFRRARGIDGPRFTNIKRLWADRRGLSDRPAASRRRLLCGVCLAAGAVAALLALARPQWGEVAEQTYDQSREVMLALDLSRSMLADDVAPSRLARAKLLIESLLDQLKGERVGLIVFSGTAFVQSPLSADYEVLRDFLGELDPSYLPEGGTDYESMLRTATQAFGQQGDGDRYLVVLSDGEALDENWKSLVPALHDRGIRVIGLGVGTPQGALVPDGAGGLVKDEHGAAVLSHLEPRTLQELATATGGTYRDAATWVDIAELVNATVEQGTKGTYVEQRNVRLQDRYQWFLAPALFFLLLSYWLEFPISPLARALPTRGRRPHPASAPAIAAALVALAAWHSPSLASTAVSDAPPPQSGTAGQPNPLTATVAELSNKPDLAAADFARLATDTIQFASQPSAPQDQSRAGVIDDGLAAVDRGAANDPHAADWASLRRQLEQLKQVKQEPPPPQQQQQQQQKQPQQQGQNGGQQDQSQSGGGGEQNAKPDQQQAGSGQQQAKQDQSQTGQGGSSSDSSPQAEMKHQPSGKGGQDGRHDEQQKADDQPKSAGAQAQSGEQKKDEQKGDDGAEANADQDASKQQQAAGEVQRQENTEPLDAPEAGLSDRAAPQAKQEPEPKSEKSAGAATAQPAAAPPPATRKVGGGRALQSVELQGDAALAQALGQMERVKDGDAPAVLFDRMNRAEGQPRAEKHGKNW
jgi:Ca-activated chloride channel homolog